MKSILVTLKIALFLLCFAGKNMAQYAPLKSNIVDDFVGTWEYRHNGELFQIILVKGTYSLETGDVDCIVGGYLYRKGSTVVADYRSNLPARVDKSSFKNLKILGISPTRSTPVKATKLNICFEDDQMGGKSSGVEGSTLTLLTPTTARWVLGEPEGVVLFDLKDDYPDGFSIPTNVVLTKVVVETPPNQPNPRWNPASLLTGLSIAGSGLNDFFIAKLTSITFYYNTT